MTTSPEDQKQKPDIDELQAEIEQTREQLGETVEALTAKLDVKTRTKDRLNETKDQAVAKLDAGKVKAVELTGSARDAATDEQGKPTPQVLIGAAVVVSAIVALSVVAWRRRR